MTKDGKETLVGISGISKDGILDHALHVPKELRKQGISKRIYAEADRIGFKSVEASYGPKSDNFKESWKHYDPAKKNIDEALFKTPAGKAARERDLVPVIEHIGKDIIRVNWVKR